VIKVRQLKLCSIVDGFLESVDRSINSSWNAEGLALLDEVFDILKTVVRESLEFCFIDFDQGSQAVEVSGKRNIGVT